MCGFPGVGVGDSPLWTQEKTLNPRIECFVIFCSHRLKFKFKRGSLPPTMPLEFVGCIGGCDETLREILALRFSQGAARVSQPASQTSGYLQASQSLNRMDSGQQGQPRPPVTRPSKALTRTLPPPAVESESNSVTCNCGQEALLLTVRKEGPNQGRQFYKCGSGGCSFFLWADSGHPGAGPPSSASRPPGGPLEHPPGSGTLLGGSSRPGSGGSGGASCLCGQPAVTRTVQKEGPNQGCQFHTCAQPREHQCGFFQWVDENVAPGEGWGCPPYQDFTPAGSRAACSAPGKCPALHNTPCTAALVSVGWWLWSCLPDRDHEAHTGHVACWDPHGGA